MEPLVTLLDQNDVAELLNVKPRTLEDWRLKGCGPRFVKISQRCVRYREIDVLDWTARRVVASTSQPVAA